MDNRHWAKHLCQWQDFLKIRLEQVSDNGEKAKIYRQLSAIEDIKYAAVLNPQVLIEFICPARTPIYYGGEIQYQLNLNASQKRAVSIALGNNPLSLIQGPPGTGKTQVIAEICLQLYRMNPDIRILVCSETHIAVNNLITRIAERDSTIRIVRIRDKEGDATSDSFSPGAIIGAYTDWLYKNLRNDELVELIDSTLTPYSDKSLEKALALSANITGMTCNRVGAYNFDGTFESFDVVIIDEVCKATLPEILMPLAVAQKAILVGDPKQLPPVFCSEELDIIRSIDRCCLQKYMYVDHIFDESKCVTVLDTQYRMAHPIGDMISQLFYDGRLLNGTSSNSIGKIIWYDYEPQKMWPPVSQESNNLQIYNLEECQIILNLLKKMDNEASKNQTVAVITPYRSQVFKLRKMLQSVELQYISPRIDTVDGFQGRESDTVIFSLTRTHGPYRFLADYRRVNVALSRAKSNIYLIGSLAYAKTNSLLGAIVEYCEIKKIEGE